MKIFGTGRLFFRDKAIFGTGQKVLGQDETTPIQDGWNGTERKIFGMDET